MPHRQVYTILFSSRGGLDQPAVAVCRALRLTTEGPTVARALEAMSHAIEVFESVDPDVLTSSEHVRRLARPPPPAAPLRGTRRGDPARVPDPRPDAPRRPPRN